MHIPLPLLWGIGAVVPILVSFSGMLPLVLSGGDTVLHDTYYVVAHAHFVLPWSAAFVGFALFYLLAPKFWGRSYNAPMGAAHFWLTFVGVSLILSPMVGLALFGRPESYVDYPASFAFWNWVSLVGYGVSAVGSLAFMAVLFDLVFRRSPNGSQV